MKTYLPSHGTLLAVFWAGGFSAAVGIALWLLTSALTGLIVSLALFAVLFSLCLLHRIGYCVEVRGKELVITRGFFLKSIQKLPLRYITGTTRLTTPLSRLLGVGILTIASSGRFTALIGLSLPEITALRSFLTERQGQQ